MAAIEIRGLQHTYKKHIGQKPKQALRGLDLVVHEGEVFGYLGANGAGKTTTIKALVGLIRATRGEASIFGVSVRDVASRRLVGFQPENPYFYEYLTARETLDFYAALCDVPAPARKTKAEELLAFVGLTDAIDVRVREYSKGMRQRLGIAQALIHNPKLVILDEPMSGLDPVGRMQVREAILSLKERGLTVFFSSHILGDVEMICDRVGMLQDGVLAACGPLHEMLSTQSKQVEVGGEGISDACHERLRQSATQSFGEGAQSVYVYASWDDADAAVAAIREDGGRLRLLRPVRESLEEYFMRSTGKSRQEVGAWRGGADA